VKMVFLLNSHRNRLPPHWWHECLCLRAETVSVLTVRVGDPSTATSAAETCRGLTGVQCAEGCVTV
jgi:hypothetical protein